MPVLRDVTINPGMQPVAGRSARVLLPIVFRKHAEQSGRRRNRFECGGGSFLGGGRYRTGGLGIGGILLIILVVLLLTGRITI